jgi:hypothetical protein
MNAVFEPSLMFISDEDWYVAEKRDAFLQHFSDHLECIDVYDICQILWTEEFDILMWETPQMHPWQQEYWAAMQIIPNLYKILNNRTNYDFYCEEKSANVSPKLQNEIITNNANEIFLKLVHTLIAFEEDFYLCVGSQNKLSANQKYHFSCDCHKNLLIPVLHNSAVDWFPCINILAKFFPQNVAEFDDKFQKGLDFIRKKDFQNKPYLFDFEFTKNFKKSIVGRTTCQEDIFIAIVKKLIFTSQEAANSDLHDEFITQKGLNQGRIRVTQRPTSTRIHYDRDKNGKIIFLAYYGEGEHDVAL